MNSFAQWEKSVRLLDDQAMIWTEVDSSGQVVRAFTAGQSWQLAKD